MTHCNPLPIIGITMGDPAGIGPEIITQTLADPHVLDICRPVIIGDRGILEKAGQLTGISLPLIPGFDTGRTEPGTIHVLEKSALDGRVISLPSPTAETGRAMESYILAAVDLAIAGEIQAMVTAPITKTGLKMAGSLFPGHTELIAHRTGTLNYAMMLAGDRLKVVLVTIHQPLAQVAGNLTRSEVKRIIDLTHWSLAHRFGIKTPKLAVAGFNPHAGEEGMFGQEETEIIAPAVEEARHQGLDVSGPLPPDTVFYHAVKGRFDAVVCMYHDQGLIPFKLIHFEDGVNTTLGLPIIRTSVDHGTAYDIAWKGLANPASMKAAIRMAVRQTSHRRDLSHGQ